MHLSCALAGPLDKGLCGRGGSRDPSLDLYLDRKVMKSCQKPLLGRRPLSPRSASYPTRRRLLLHSPGSLPQHVGKCQRAQELPVKLLKAAVLHLFTDWKENPPSFQLLPAAQIPRYCIGLPMCVPMHRCRHTLATIHSQHQEHSTNNPFGALAPAPSAPKVWGMFTKPLSKKEAWPQQA